MPTENQQRSQGLNGLWSSFSLEQDRLEAEAEYRAMVREWGRMGGLATLKRYGREHFRCLARKRWSRR